MSSLQEYVFNSLDSTLSLKIVGEDGGTATSDNLQILRAQASQPNDHIILFLPFWGGSASTFRNLLQHLRAQDAATTFMAISYSGTAGTSVADDAPAQHSIEPRAALLARMLQSSGFEERFGQVKLTICAHSMSAKIAYVLLGMLSDDPAYRLRIRALVLLAPAPIEPLHLPPEMRQQQLHAYDSFESAQWTIENVLTHRALVEDVVHDLARDCSTMTLGAKRGWLDHGMTFDCADAVAKIKTAWPDLKVKILVGEQDKVETPRRVAEQTVRVLTTHGFDVESNVIEECGHLLPVEAVKEVAKHIGSMLPSST